MNISDIWVFFGIAKSLGMFMLNREYAIKDFGKSRLFSLQNELYATFCTLSEVRHLGSRSLANVVSHCVSAF